MTTRFRNRLIQLNSNPSFKKQFENRNVKFIHQYTTGQLKYPTTEQMSELTIVGHVWTIGDRFYKLAHEHYGDPQLWWIIAWYNQTPLESHLKLGDVIEVPFPLQRVLRMMEV